MRMAMLMASNEKMGEFIDSLAFSSPDKKDWRALQNALLDWVLTDGPNGPIG
jgi:threonine dehydratase